MPFLRFAAGTTDKITITNPQTFGAGTTFSYLMWYLHTATNTTNSRGFQKGAVGDCFVYSTTNSGSFRFSVSRATTAADFFVDDALFLNNTWYFLAGTYSETNGAQLYRGTRNSDVALMTPLVVNVGSGNTTADTGDLWINNRSAVSTLSLPIDVAYFCWYNRELSLAELQSVQYNTNQLEGCLIRMFPGYNGSATTQIDFSGNNNHGTRTGTTVQSSEFPLGFPNWHLQGLGAGT